MLRVDFWGPHQPFFPTQEFLDMYDPEKILEYPTFNSKLKDKPHTLHMEANRPIGDGENIIYPNPISWGEWQKILAHCYAHGTMLDAAGGMIVDKIKELGLDENTIIIWSTDHGDAIACQGGHFDKDSHMAQEVMRIPMAMVWKGVIDPEQICDKLVFTCDIPVTMLDAAETKFSNPVDGKSLLDLALHKEQANQWRKELMCETYGHGYGLTIIGRMITDGKWKYVCTEDDLDELYDLESDPYEKVNLATIEKYYSKVEEMRERLKKLQQEHHDPIKLEDLLTKAEK